MDRLPLLLSTSDADKGPPCRLSEGDGCASGAVARLAVPVENGRLWLCFGEAGASGRFEGAAVRTLFFLGFLASSSPSCI